MDIDGQVENIISSGIRCDSGNCFLWKTLLYNNRFDYYRLYLKIAERLGYKICTFYEFYKNRRSSEKHLILRHDVDHINNNTRSMYELEKSVGVKSSYYFRFSTIDIDLIKDMIVNGFEVGLHYETLANYALENNIQCKEDINLELVSELLKSDIDKFESIIENKTFTCASHGSTVNLKLGISNNVLFEIRPAEFFGVQVEVYNAELYKKYIISHIMDGNLRINYGFSYETNPIESLLNGDKNIIFLTHPDHWKLSFSQRIKLFSNLALGRTQKESSRHFMRILK